MARKKRYEEESIGEREESRTLRGASIRTGLRFAGLTLALVATVFGAAWTLWQGETFMQSDARFRISHEDENDKAIVIRGARNAQMAALTRVFAPDRGRSLYELDPEKRRENLRTVEWVKDASVRRIWPNRVAVEIVERQPVAFIQVPSGASGSFENPVSYEPRLIDEDGFILTVRGAIPKELPLLTGVRRDEDIEIRRARVQKMIKLMAGAGEYGRNISEVDAARTDNLKAVYQVDGRQVTLILGSERYRERIELFLRNWEKGRDNVQPGDSLDLTYDDRIIVKKAPAGMR